jgi:hypothetical protein
MLPDASMSPQSLAKVQYFGRCRGYDVWGIDGCFVRCILDIDFALGGNPGRYSYVPRSEIWIESQVPHMDVVGMLVHERVECELMHRNGLDYDKAHNKANVYERIVRDAMIGGRLGNVSSYADAVNIANSWLRQMESLARFARAVATITLPLVEIEPQRAPSRDVTLSRFDDEQFVKQAKAIFAK